MRLLCLVSTYFCEWQVFENFEFLNFSLKEKGELRDIRKFTENFARYTENFAKSTKIREKHIHGKICTLKVNIIRIPIR